MHFKKFSYFFGEEKYKTMAVANSAIVVAAILDIHKYLMKKNGIL